MDVLVVCPNKEVWVSEVQANKLEDLEVVAYDHWLEEYEVVQDICHYEADGGEWFEELTGVEAEARFEEHLSRLQVQEREIEKYGKARNG